MALLRLGHAGVNGRQLAPMFDLGEGSVERGAVNLSLKVVVESLLICRVRHTSLLIPSLEDSPSRRLARNHQLLTGMEELPTDRARSVVVAVPFTNPASSQISAPRSVTVLNGPSALPRRPAWPA